MKDKGEKIVVLTAYDSSMARILEESEVDSILVGDSVGNTTLGYENTLPVTMEEMIHHTKAVARGTNDTFIIADMPFLSFQTSPVKALENAGRFVKEAEADAVKVEGGASTIKKVEKIVEAGIPVMGHLGLLPQRVLQNGSYKPHGKSPEEAKEIIENAEKLEEAGAFSIVLESIPSELGKAVTEKINIPTIGIGAGPHCDGQVLVINDLLGLSDYSPKFAKQYANLKETIKKSAAEFRDEVKSGKFPNE